VALISKVRVNISRFASIAGERISTLCIYRGFRFQLLSSRFAHPRDSVYICGETRWSIRGRRETCLTNVCEFFDENRGARHDYLVVLSSSRDPVDEIRSSRACEMLTLLISAAASIDTTLSRLLFRSLPRYLISRLMRHRARSCRNACKWKANEGFRRGGTERLANIAFDRREKNFQLTDACVRACETPLPPPSSVVRSRSRRKKRLKLMIWRQR